ASLLFLVAESVFFVFISVLHPLALLASLQICVNLRILWCVFFLAFLLVFFPLSSPFDFEFDSIFRRRVVFILSFSCGYYAVCSVSVATRTADRMYLIRTCADLTFYFCVMLRCASVITCTNYYVLFFFSPRYSSTPELLEPVLPATTDCIELWR
ncbi:unnamed protein product, partial [Laminaria digitata]